MALYEPSAFHLLRQMGERGAEPYAEITGVARRICQGVVTGDYRGAVAAFVDYWNGPGSWTALRPSVQRALIRWAPKVPLDFRALIDDPTPAAAYRALTFPVLILRGEHAPSPTRVIAEGLAEWLPASRVVDIAGAGHMGPLTHTPEVIGADRAAYRRGRGRRAAVQDLAAQAAPSVPVRHWDRRRLCRDLHDRQISRAPDRCRAVADGSRVTIRPTLPQDAELQRAFFRSLSAEVALLPLHDAAARTARDARRALHQHRLPPPPRLAGRSVRQERTRDHDRRSEIRRRASAIPRRASSPSPSRTLGRLRASRVRSSRDWSARPPRPASARMVADTLITNRAMQRWRRAPVSPSGQAARMPSWRGWKNCSSGPAATPSVRPLAA